MTTEEEMGDMALENASVAALDALLTVKGDVTQEWMDSIDKTLAAIDKELTTAKQSADSWMKQHDQLVQRMGRIKAEILSLSPESSKEDIKEAVVNVCDVLGIPTPFIEDVTEECETLEQAYSTLEDAEYALGNVKGIVDDLLGDFQAYQEGYEDYDLDDLRSRLDNVFSDYRDEFDAAERLT